jgi:hypothetical protein
MSCICNTDNIVDLGCVCYCDDVATGIETTQTGVHLVRIKYLDSVIEQQYILAGGDELVIVFDKNEDYEYIFELTYPNNVKECYQFRTQYCS